MDKTSAAGRTELGTKPGVVLVEVAEHKDEQRLDNFLLGKLKGVPKTLIYRIIRKGEVRVNGKRAKPDTRLSTGDKVRIPPVRTAETGQVPVPGKQLSERLTDSILLEDDCFLVLNKPAGLAVHAGTGAKLGVIEALRQLFPQWPGLELVHRLDKGTSGCLLLAKTGKARRALMDAFRDHTVRKTYHAIVTGLWPARIKRVDAALLRQPERGGQRMVEIDEDGKDASTEFKILRLFDQATLVEARPLTGRTHQIRVHAASIGCPLLGDDKYSVQEKLQLQERAGSNRMFLHAAKLQFPHPLDGRIITVEAPYDVQFAQAISRLAAK
ncbi:MAG: RluA family pseudouridine synthase [Gammaproteobacteria bacterium]